MIERVNVGIVGLGKMGILHAGILNALPNCSVVAIAESERLLNRVGRKLLPGLNFHESVAEMVEENELDAVYVTTPISTHLDIVSEIVGKEPIRAVFVEKPLAANPRDARKMRELTRNANVQGMVGFQKRFSPIFSRAKELIASGVFGDPVFFRAHSFVSGVFKEGKGWRFEEDQGGALLDLGPHLIDLLLWYFGDIKSSFALRKSIFSSKVEDYSHASLEFNSGLMGSIDVSWSVAGFRLPEVGIEMTGTNGVLAVTDDCLTMRTYSDSPGVEAGVYNLRRPDFDCSVDFLIGDPEYCLEDKHFVQSVASSQSVKPSFEDGVRVNEVISSLRGTEGISSRK